MTLNFPDTGSHSREGGGGGLQEGFPLCVRLSISPPLSVNKSCQQRNNLKVPSLALLADHCCTADPSTCRKLQYPILWQTGNDGHPEDVKRRRKRGCCGTTDTYLQFCSIRNTLESYAEEKLVKVIGALEGIYCGFNIKDFA